MDEYYFKVINWNKVNYEQETDPDILRSYEDFDEGEYPAHLKDDYLANLHFYSSIDTHKLQYEIFSSTHHAYLKPSKVNIHPCYTPNMIPCASPFTIYKKSLPI